MTTDKKNPKETPEQAAPEQDPKEAKINDLTQTLQRLQADFENYRKRVERDQQLQKQQSKKDIILKMISVLDNFELALKSAPKDTFAQGIEMIFAQLMDTLEQEGLRIMHVETFDPHYHEALLSETSDKEAGTILEVLQKGYLLGETVIRHAKVKIAK